MNVSLTVWSIPGFTDSCQIPGHFQVHKTSFHSSADVMSTKGSTLRKSNPFYKNITNKELIAVDSATDREYVTRQE